MSVMQSRPKISVLLDASEYARFDAYCHDRGYKKSTLIARLIRDRLNAEDFELRAIPSTGAVRRRAKRKNALLKSL